MQGATLNLRALVLGLGLSIGIVAMQAEAGEIHISVTNNQSLDNSGGGGYAISPVWVGLSNGSFSSFNTLDNLKGAPQQTIAELGSSAALTTAFNGFGPQTRVGNAPSGPGGSASADLIVANPATTQFLNYAAMVVPSNDFFFANDNAHKVQLFNSAGRLIDAAGNVTTERVIKIYGAQIWDAGTEVDDINYGAADVKGVNATDHIDANGTAHLVFNSDGSSNYQTYLNSINGVTTPNGYNINHILTSGELIATIDITTVSTPEPASIVLGTLAVACTVGVALRRRK